MKENYPWVTSPIVRNFCIFFLAKDWNKILGSFLIFVYNSSSDSTISHCMLNTRISMYIHKICQNVNHLRSLVLIIPKAAFLIFFWGITLFDKRCWLMTSLSKSSNPCVSQVTQKPFLPMSVEIDKWLSQSTLFRGLTCESSRLSLDPKIWHGSYFYLEILVCKFWQYWKMDHLPMLRSLILILIFSSQLRGGLAKYVRVDTRFQFTT